MMALSGFFKNGRDAHGSGVVLSFSVHHVKMRRNNGHLQAHFVFIFWSKYGKGGEKGKMERVWGEY
jgi:hypothetical protein